MNILSLFRYYPTLTETFAHEEVKALIRRGVNVTIASMGPRDDGVPPNHLPDCPTIQVPRRPLRATMSRHTAGSRWLSGHQRSKDVARYRWLERSLPPTDRVHVHFAGGAAEWAHALFLDRGIPYTVTVHAVDLFKPKPSLNEVLGAAQTTLTVADHHVQHLADRGVRSQRLRCGPDLNYWQHHPLPPWPFQALFVGRNVPKKGLDVLLDAWRRASLDDAHLTVIADAPASTDPTVTVRGPQPASSVREAIRSSHLLVQPCRIAPDGDMDGVPLVLMEAMATGRPVLTTPISGIPELVDEEVGWLTEPDNAAALALQLQEIVRVPEEIHSRGGAGPARLRDRGFTLSAQVDGLQRAWGCDG
jgi:glycosyltransferase involved in cell wall biosynthesis